MVWVSRAAKPLHLIPTVFLSKERGPPPCNNLNWPALIVGGTEDHVHALCRFGKNIEIANLVRDMKRDSSKWIKTKGSRLADFDWQAGYGAFSISPSHVEAMKEYIVNQMAHHRRETFQDEFRRLWKKYRLPVDERFVSD